LNAKGGDAVRDIEKGVFAVLIRLVVYAMMAVFLVALLWMFVTIVRSIV
jgi:hypothetical protein